MQLRRSARSASLLFIALSAKALAHPGHDLNVVPSDSGWHYLLQPEHGLGLGLVAIAGLLMIIPLAKRVRRQGQGNIAS